jgi:hypothetical protein
MGPGLDDCFYWHFFTITITTAHNQWLLKTRSIPHWTTSVFSSTGTTEEFLLTPLTALNDVKVKVTLRLTVSQSVNKSWHKAPTWSS